MPGGGRGGLRSEKEIASTGTGSERASARISRQASAAAADTGMSASLRSVGLLDAVSTTSADPSVASVAEVSPGTFLRHERRCLPVHQGTDGFPDGRNGNTVPATR
jgi:hypothetical protein